jgi:hypothetical protein
MSAKSKAVVALGQEALNFLSNLADKFKPSENLGALSNMPYVQLGEPVFEGGKRVVPGSRAEVVVPSGDMNPKLFNSIQSQQRDIDEITRDIENIPAQENRSPQMIREDMLSMQKWIDSKKDLPGFYDMIYPMMQQIEKDKAILNSRTALRGLD